MVIYIKSHNVYIERESTSQVSARALCCVSHLFIPFLQSLQIVLCRVVAMYCVCSFCFLHISLAAGHHHPDIWHAGDVFNHDDEPLRGGIKSGTDDAVSVNKDKTIDWGVFQLITVGRRPTIDSSVPLAAVSFGLHQLHHLFPTVDHSKLPLLQEMFRETCKEFKLEIFADSDSSSFKGRNWGDKRTFTVFEGWLGMVQQVN
jgi:hypothetical protein